MPWERLTDKRYVLTVHSKLTAKVEQRDVGWVVNIVIGGHVYLPSDFFENFDWKFRDERLALIIADTLIEELTDVRRKSLVIVRPTETKG